jgi:hypothetical protein
VTHRFFDWPELGRKTRELHVEQGLAAMRDDIALAPARMVAEGWLQAPGTAAFAVRIHAPVAPREITREGSGFTVFVCLEGECELTSQGEGRIDARVLRPADLLLAPASFARFEVYPRGGCRLLEVTESAT